MPFPGRMRRHLPGIPADFPSFHPMISGRKTPLFHIAGAGVIVFWLVMLGMLVKKISFNNSPQLAEIISKKNESFASGHREWMEIYLKGKKVGYAVNQVTPVEDDFLVQEEIFLRLDLPGRTADINSLSRSITDRAFRLKSFRFRMISGAVTYRVSGTVTGRRMSLEMGEGKARRRISLALSEPPVMGSGMAWFFRGRKPVVGRAYRFSVFDPSTLSQKEMTIRVAGRDTVIIARVRHPAIRLEGVFLGQPVTFWLDENGGVLKETGLMGFTLVRSSAANAPRNLAAGEGGNFYRLSAVSVKRKLKAPARLRYLKLRVRGMETSSFDPVFLNRGRQRFRSGVLEITRETIPGDAGYRIPYRAADEVSFFLRPEPNIESDDPVVAARAKRIVKETRNPVTAARRIMSWVYENVEKRPVVNVPSAAAVLRTRAGDCNEHAVLLAALLRAAGIPARLCVGLVYARGRFYYHAWVEAYLGKWISMDPTFNQMPADVTHIKLVQGGLEKQVAIIGVIGRIGLEILDHRP
ncbi:MAG: hypothetical protein DRH56_05325 [Deltaproteobacteria bacterium]|nr:MAG: hypothetical protein DRH56_05325 [Deltaproteobacteria bacterium]